VVTLQDKGGEKRVHKLEQRYQHSGDKPDATAEHSLQATPKHPTSLTSEGQPTAASNKPDTGTVVTQSGDRRGSATPNLVSPAVAGVARRPKPKPATKAIPMSGGEMEWGVLASDLNSNQCVSQLPFLSNSTSCMKQASY